MKSRLDKNLTRFIALWLVFSYSAASLIVAMGPASHDCTHVAHHESAVHDHDTHALEERKALEFHADEAYSKNHHGICSLCLTLQNTQSQSFSDESGVALLRQADTHLPLHKNLGLAFSKVYLFSPNNSPPA